MAFACTRPKTSDEKINRNIPLEKRLKDSSKEDVELNHLNLTDNDIPYVIKKVIKNKKCQHLSLANNQITDQGIRLLINSILKKSQLTHLNLSSNPLGDQSIPFLKQLIEGNRTIYHLSLANSNLTDEGFQSLIETLATNSLSLRTLDVRSNEKITDASIPALIQMVDRNQTLSACRLDQCRLTEQGLSQLKEDKSIKW